MIPSNLFYEITFNNMYVAIRVVTYNMVQFVLCYFILLYILYTTMCYMYVHIKHIPNPELYVLYIYLISTILILN